MYKSKKRLKEDYECVSSKLNSCEISLGVMRDGQRIAYKMLEEQNDKYNKLYKEYVDLLTKHEILLGIKKENKQ